MSDNQNQLPASFSIDLVRHGDEWHVTRLHDRRFQNGNVEAQPQWEQLEAKLTALGYTEVDEIPNQPGAQRKLVLTKPAAPSLLDNLINPAVSADNLLQQHSEPVSSENTVHTMTRKKYGRL